MPIPTLFRSTSLTDKPRVSAQHTPNTLRERVSHTRTAETLLKLLERTTFLRCLITSIVALLIGVGLLHLLLPYLSSDTLEQTLSSHLPGDTFPWLSWLRLCVARFPVYLLLAVAGLTRFSGGLTTAVLVWRGVCDGAVISLLLSSSGLASLRADFLLPSLFPVAFVIWILVDLVTRTYISSASRRFARVTAGTNTFLPSQTAERAEVRYLLWRHMAIALGSFAVTFAANGLYIGLLSV